MRRSRQMPHRSFVAEALRRGGGRLGKPFLWARGVRARATGTTEPAHTGPAPPPSK